MPRQLLYTGGACALAACVLVLTLLLSPDVREPGRAAPASPDPGARYTPAPDPNAAQAGTGKSPILPGGEAENLYIRKVNEPKNQVYIFSGKRVRPKPNGVADVDEPTAHIHLIPGQRVIEIRGKSGTLVAPDNNPESGVLSGGVVMTWFDAPPGEAANLAADSPHVVGRAFADDEVRFDLELGLMETKGPVQVTSSFFDVQAVGFALSYNEKRKEVARIEFSEGREIRVNPKSAPSSRTSDAADPSGEKPASEQPRRPYMATFARQVQAAAGGASVGAARLRVHFSMGNAQESKNGGDAPQPAKPSTSLAAPDKSIAAPPASPPPALTGRSLMPPSKDDIVVFWRGPLVIEPVDAAPEPIAADEAFFTFEGEVKAADAHGAAIVADKLDYVTGRERVRIFGKGGAVASLQSRDLGRLDVMDALEIDQKTGKGFIRGAGTLTAQAVKKGDDADPTARPKQPGEMVLRWTEGVDLQFKSQPAAAGTSAKRPAEGAGMVRLDALQQAVFRGKVEAAHPDLNLKSRRLTVDLTTSKDRRQDIGRITAQGEVAVAAKDQKDQAVRMEAGELDLAFAPDTAGRMQPAKMVARENVTASQPGRKIEAGMMDVTLGQAVAGATPQAAGTALGKLAITQMVATQQVRITLDDPRTRVTADRLEANVAAGVMHLFGQGDDFAHIDREDNKLSGRHLVLMEKDQAIQAIGPGAADFTIDRADKAKAKPAQPVDVEAADAAAPAGVAAAPPGRIRINWTDAMDFNNTTGVGHFKGSVVATSDRGLDVTRFQAGELAMELEPAKPQAGKRAVRKMVAKRSVVFEAEKWTDRLGGKLETRFRLTGPLLEFDNGKEQLEVTGAGTMQIEDYREKQTTAAAASGTASTEGGGRPVAFVGGGVTLFLWQERLLLDAARNDVRMSKDVKLIQLARGSKDEVQLHCGQLVADFASTGGLASWLSGKPAEPKLDNVTATESVRILYRKQELRGDQLYYTGVKQLVVLSAEGDRQCTLDDDNTSLPARRFRWYLDRDKIVAEEPGAIRTKIK